MQNFNNHHRRRAPRQSTGAINVADAVVKLAGGSKVDQLYSYPQETSISSSDSSGKRTGDADVKFYMENDGEEPDFLVEYEALRDQYMALDITHETLPSKRDRVREDLKSSKALLASMEAELRKMRRDFKTRTLINSCSQRRRAVLHQHKHGSQCQGSIGSEGRNQ